MFEVINTFPKFKSVFQDNLEKTVDEKIKIWLENYINYYPELKQKCINDYENNGYNWNDIARDMVFNRTAKDFIKMNEAHNNIIGILNKIESNIDYSLDIVIVIYCGLCNSAGWVDTFKNKRAILFGLDKIAELNWHEKERLEALVSHELCHVVHFEMRGTDSLPQKYINDNYYEGIWRVYEEGFAQYFQHVLLDKQVYSRGKNWLEKCKAKEKDLKQIYLKKLYDGGVNDFYGDWFSILDISDAGYYLGEKFISILNEEYSMEQIAKLDFKTIEEKVLVFLQNLNI